MKVRKIGLWKLGMRISQVNYNFFKPGDLPTANSVCF